MSSWMSIPSRRTSTTIQSATGTRIVVLKGPNTSTNPNHWNGASTSSFNTTDNIALTSPVVQSNHKRNQIYHCSIYSKLISSKNNLYCSYQSWILGSNKHLSLINSFNFVLIISVSSEIQSIWENCWYVFIPILLLTNSRDISHNFIVIITT